MTLSESLGRLRLSQDVAKYHWAITELGFSPNVDHVREIIRVSDRENLDVVTVLAIVTGESGWRPTVVGHNRGSNDYGLFQLNNIWHNQHRSNVNAHIRTGIEHYKWCLDTEHRNERRALSRYNTGNGENAAGRRYASYILGYKTRIINKARQFRVRGM